MSDTGTFYLVYIAMDVKDLLETKWTNLAKVFMSKIEVYYYKKRMIV